MSCRSPIDAPVAPTRAAASAYRCSITRASPASAGFATAGSGRSSSATTAADSATASRTDPAWPATGVAPSTTFAAGGGSHDRAAAVTWPVAGFAEPTRTGVDVPASRTPWVVVTAVSAGLVTMDTARTTLVAGGGDPGAAPGPAPTIGLTAAPAPAPAAPPPSA